MRIILAITLLSAIMTAEGKVYISRKGSSDTTKYELKQDMMNVITQDSTSYVKYEPFDGENLNGF